jgi:hypothetical protein
VSVANLGYYTDFTLEFQTNDDLEKVRIEQEIEKSPYMHNAYAENGDSQKWYDYEEEMQAFSRAFPDVLFTLSGIGEEQGDVWTKYFLNGKMQECRAVLTHNPVFDKEKLK